MCPLRGERARGLAPSAGAGEASFWADPATVGWFNSSRQLHFLIAQVILGNRTALLCYSGRSCCITSGATAGTGTSPPSAPPTGMDG